MEERKTIGEQLPDAEEMARQLARAPEDKRALITTLGAAMSAAMQIGAAIAEQRRDADTEKTA